MKTGQRLLYLAGAIAAVILLYGGVTNYIEGNKMSLVAYGKAPKDHSEFGYELQYRLDPIRYNQKYKYKAEGPLTSSFNYEAYKEAHPKDPIYMARVSGKNGEPWLVIFSDTPPLGYGLVYKKNN